MDTVNIEVKISGLEESISDVKELKKEVSDLGNSNVDLKADGAITTVKELKTHISELRDKLVTAEYASEEWKSTANELAESVAQLNNVQKAEKQQLDINEGSYNAIQSRMKELTAVYKSMAVVTDEDREKQKSLGAEINALNDKLKALDAEIGNHQRNVGDYSTALTGLAGAFGVADKASKDMGDGFASVSSIITAVTGSSNGAAAAFSELQAGMNLASNVSKGLGKSMGVLGDMYQKVNGYMKSLIASRKADTTATNAQTASTVGLTAAEGASTVATKALSVALKGLKAALIATGIGAIVVLVGELINGLSSLFDWLKNVTAGADEYKAQNDELNKSFEKENELIGYETNLMQAQGVETSKIIQKKKELIQAQIEETKAAIANAQARIKQLEADSRWWKFWQNTKGKIADVNKDIEELTKTLEGLEKTDRQLSNELEVETIKSEKKKQEARKESAKKAAEAAKKAAEEEKKRLQALRKDSKSSFDDIANAWRLTVTSMNNASKLFDVKGLVDISKIDDKSLTARNMKALTALLGIDAKSVSALAEQGRKNLSGAATEMIGQALQDALDTKYDKLENTLNTSIDKVFNEALSGIDLSKAFDTASVENLAKEIAKTAGTTNVFSSEVTELFDILNSSSKQYEKEDKLRGVIAEIVKRTDEWKNSTVAIETEYTRSVDKIINLRDEVSNLGVTIEDVNGATRQFNQDFIELGNVDGYSFEALIDSANRISETWENNFNTLKSAYDQGIIDFETYALGVSNAQKKFNEDSKKFRDEYLSGVVNMTDTQKQALEVALVQQPKEIVQQASTVLKTAVTNQVDQATRDFATQSAERARENLAKLGEDVATDKRWFEAYIGEPPAWSVDDWNPWKKLSTEMNAEFEITKSVLETQIAAIQEILNDPDKQIGMTPEDLGALQDELNGLMLEKNQLANEQMMANAQMTAENVKKSFEGAASFISEFSNITSALLTKHQQDYQKAQDKLNAVQESGDKKAIAEAEKRAKEEEEQLLAAWKLNKAAQYASTVVNTAQSAMSAFSAMAGIPIVGPALGGVAAAMAVAAGAIQLHTIAQQEPPTKNGSSGGASVPSSGGGASTPSIDVNALLNYDQQSDRMNDDYYSDLQADRQSSQRVYVVESDISDTSNTVKTQVSQSSF